MPLTENFHPSYLISSIQCLSNLMFYEKTKTKKCSQIQQCLVTTFNNIISTKGHIEEYGDKTKNCSFMFGGLIYKPQYVLCKPYCGELNPTIIFADIKANEIGSLSNGTMRLYTRFLKPHNEFKIFKWEGRLCTQVNIGHGR